jgi:hypothetical protein
VTKLCRRRPVWSDSNGVRRQSEISHLCNVSITDCCNHRPTDYIMEDCYESASIDRLQASLGTHWASSVCLPTFLCFYCGSHLLWYKRLRTSHPPLGKPVPHYYFLIAPFFRCLYFGPRYVLKGRYLGRYSSLAGSGHGV